MRSLADDQITAAVNGDERAFAEVVERHRRELHVHAYRMLASFEEAEDAVQETFLRAWRHREQLDGVSLFRAWLYRVTTNVCLDQLRRRSRRPTVTSFMDLPWLEPYPDQLLDELPATGTLPDAQAVDRETISLAFLAALQALPPRQRAVVIVRDVLGWPASDTAELLDTTVAAANSALQRGRATLQSYLPPRRADWSTATASAAERALLERFIDAHERCDAAAAIAIAASDIRVTMPPNPHLYDGVAAVRDMLERGFGPGRDGDWRLVPTRSNRLPAAASYLRRYGDSRFRAFKIDVLRIDGDRIAEITTFGVKHFPAFGLPPVLD